MYSDGGGTDDFEVVNLLDNAPDDVIYDTEDTGETPWFIQGTEHQPDRLLTNQEYYNTMEKVAEENNPIWNSYRREKGEPELTVDEEYTRILNDNSYDYRGYYNDPSLRDEHRNADTHWTDHWKTAYHPTFSNQSLYSGIVDQNYNPAGKVGGTWLGDTFIPNDTLIPETHAYGGNLFNNGGTKNQKAVGGVRGLLNLFDKYNIPYRQTSGLRKGAKTASGHASYHSMTDAWGNPRAVDIAGDFEKIKQMAYSNPEIVAYMQKEGLGILEETTGDVKKKTHATGDHFHIGPDKWAIQMRDNNLKKYDATYHPMQDVTWEDVQARRQRMELTPEEEALLNSKPSTVFNPEYDDENQESEFARQFALNETLDREPSPMEKWQMFNSMLTPSQGQDSFDWLTSVASMSPSVSPEQKQALSNYQLFNMSGDGGQLYHGLSFAAYGGKVNRFDDGGYETQQEKILNRAKQRIDEGYVYNNYEDGVDASLKSKIIAPWTRFASNLKSIRIPALGSNCTLNASQWVNPRVPIISAATIENNPNQYGYIEIPEEYAAPGDMVIVDNDNGVYHTMLLSGFAPEDNLGLLNGDWYDVSKGDPMVTYSKGKYGPENLVYNVPLAGYIDQSEGKTDVHYYRHPYEEGFEGLIPPLIVTPQGAGFDLTGPVDSIKHYMYPNR